MPDKDQFMTHQEIIIKNNFNEVINERLKNRILQDKFMQELVLKELKVYAKEVNSKFMQRVRKRGRKLGFSKEFTNIYSKQTHILYRNALNIIQMTRNLLKKQLIQTPIQLNLFQED